MDHTLGKKHSGLWMSAFGWMNLIANAKVLVNKYKHLQDECLYKYVNQLSNI